jgi:hypothetical protein
MFAKIFRRYWYPGHPGYERIYKKHFLSKRAKINEISYITDPIDRRNFQGFIDCVHGEQNPVETIFNHLQLNPTLDVSSGTTSYMAYQAALDNLQDENLWKEIDFHIVVKFSEMTNRMLFGCLYGLIKLGKGRLNVLESVIKEYNSKALPTIAPFELFQLIEACCLSPGDKFDAMNYMHEHLMPILRKRFNKFRFIHIESYLLKFINLLSKAEYFEPWIWEKINEIVKKKKFGDIDVWEVFYRTIHELNLEEIKNCAGVDLNESLVHLENMFNRHPDHKWKYKLDEKRFFTIEEMIDRVKDTPNDITWQEGEEMIKHSLPKWYWEYDLNIKTEYSGLYDEYMNLNSK